ncbi:MAG: hypothetical protein ACJ78Y_14820 [Myxococcales bacterium]
MEESRRRNRKLPPEAVQADAAILTHSHIDHGVEVLNAFSAHPDRNNLLAYVEACGAVRRMFLVHRETGRPTEGWAASAAPRFADYTSNLGKMPIAPGAHGSPLAVPWRIGIDSMLCRCTNSWAKFLPGESLIYHVVYLHGAAAVYMQPGGRVGGDDSANRNDD